MDKKTQMLIDEYLGYPQDYESGFWKDPMHEKLYLEAYEEKLDPADADRYVFLYDLLERNVGMGSFRTLNSDMWNKYDAELLEADKEKNNEEWKILCQLLNEMEE